jgi:hypothetical protein
MSFLNVTGKAPERSLERPEAIRKAFRGDADGEITPIWKVRGRLRGAGGPFA